MCYVSSRNYIASLPLPLLQSQFIAQCLTEIKAELRQENAVVKANAVSKLTYVSDLYCDSCKRTGWYHVWYGAAFHASDDGFERPQL